MTAAAAAMPATGVLSILAAVGVSAATFYRHRRPKPPRRPRAASARALSPEERQDVLSLLHAPRFVDKAPAEIVATLLEEGTHHCSERTMYRILAAHGEVKERRDQLRHPAYAKPELVATAPDQVWSWDITKLRTFVAFQYLYLYVILDIFSRYVVGWLLADRESAALAERLVEETCAKRGIRPAHLHADRGAPMKSKLLVQLLAQLDINRSHSRPHVSNDNPFSEAQFKTLKYHPSFPDRFGGIDQGLTFCRSFFPWYNDEHHHSALAYLTPRQVHYGLAEEQLRRRHEVLIAAYRAHPERFVGGPPRMPSLSRAVYINPPTPAGDNDPATPTPASVSPGSAATQPQLRAVNAPAFIAAGGAAGSTPVGRQDALSPIFQAASALDTEEAHHPNSTASATSPTSTEEGLR